MTIVNVTAGAQAFTSNAFLVTGEVPTLVDVGTISGVEDVVREHTDRLDQVVLTHQHPDHVDELGAVLGAFDDTACLAFADHPRRTRPISDGDEVQIGDESFEVIHTPGHADDHVALVSDTTLFSGDVVVHDDGAFDDGSFGKTDLPGGDREVLIASIRALLDRLPPTVEHMYSGHGGEFHGDVHTVVERALERAERREPKYPEG